MKPLTICVLLYGDYPDLAERCLGSIERSLSEGSRYVAAFRVGLNECSPPTHVYVRDLVSRLESDYPDIRVDLYATDKNVCKYPMMRTMFREPDLIATQYIMWFDDDSYFNSEKVDHNWWPAMFDAIRDKAMIGQHWLMPIQGNQWEWIRSQSWFNNKVGLPPKKAKGRPAFEFCQGAWWVAETKTLLYNDWPLPEIKHNGGDSMLGELLRHRRKAMGKFFGGVHINADATGRKSSSKRRGYTEDRVGWDYQGTPLDTGHQYFEYQDDYASQYPPKRPSTKIINLFSTETHNPFE